MALPHAPNVADLGIDFTDEFAHLGLITEFAGRVDEALGLITEFAGRVDEALGLVINRSSDRRLDVSRTIPSAQSLAVEPSAARDRVAECRITSMAPGRPVSRSERSSLPGRVEVWLIQLPASLDRRQVYVHRIGARPSKA
jgi:hypothetical protein